MEADRYYVDLASAFVRGKLGEQTWISAEETIRAGIRAGLKLHKFKRNAELPRVRKVLGILRGLAPRTLVDIGSGRGTFLWPLLDSFSELAVTALDRSPGRVSDIQAVRRGGLQKLNAVVGDVCNLCLGDQSADVVTLLEVLEHLERPEAAAREAIRVSRNFVIVSVPSKEDDNPEHIHLFGKSQVEGMFLSAGARGVKFEFVLNHMIAVVKI